MDLTPILITAASTALFTYIADRVRWRVELKHNMINKHDTALVSLQYLLNEYLGVISDNIYVMKLFIIAIRTPENGLVKLQWNLPKLININTDSYLKLLDLEILNKLFRFNDDLRKTNDDIEALNHGYEVIRLGLIQKYLDNNQYIINAKEIANGFELEERFLTEIRQDTEKLLARVRLQIIKDRSRKKWVFYKQYTTATVSTEEVLHELGRMKSEFEEIKKASKDRIDKLLDGKL